MFCGLLMGLVMPPRLDASAMPARGAGSRHALPHGTCESWSDATAMPARAQAAVTPYPNAHAQADRPSGQGRTAGVQLAGEPAAPEDAT